jgi:hypothetical protein
MLDLHLVFQMLADEVDYEQWRSFIAGPSLSARSAYASESSGKFGACKSLDFGGLTPEQIKKLFGGG